jgi:hypothetical protein
MSSTGNITNSGEILPTNSAALPPSSIKPYLDVFGDRYYTRPNNSNKSRSVGVKNAVDFYDKYKVSAEKQQEVLGKFSNIFGSEYLFGDKTGAFGSAGQGASVCRPDEIKDVMPYLKNRIETLEIDINLLPGSGPSLEKNRLAGIKGNIERYVALMESSNSTKMKACEIINGIENPMNDAEMLQYLAKVLYFGIYPEKAAPNIRKCVADIRGLKMDGTLKNLLTELKKQETDKMLAFLKMASVAVASVSGSKSTEAVSFRSRLSAFFDKLKPGVGKKAFSGTEPLPEQFKAAVAATGVEGVMNAKKDAIPPSLEEEINRILRANKTYPLEIVALLTLLRHGNIAEFVAKLNELFNIYDEQIKELKAELDEKIAKLDKNSADLTERESHTILSRLRRILGKKPADAPAVPDAVDAVSAAAAVPEGPSIANVYPEKGNGTFSMENPIKKRKDVYQEVVPPEKVGFWLSLLKKTPKGQPLPVEAVKKIDETTKDIDAKLKAAEAKVAELEEEIAKLKSNPAITPDVERLTKLIQENPSVSVDDIINKIKQVDADVQVAPDEAVKKINQMINELEEIKQKGMKTEYNIKGLLEAIKALKKKICDVPVNMTPEEEEGFKKLQEEINANMQIHNQFIDKFKEDYKEEYLNIITKLVKNDMTHMGMMRDIVAQYQPEAQSDNSEMKEALGVPDDLEFNDVFIEILNRLKYAGDVPQFNDLVVPDNKVKSLLMEVAKLILIMSQTTEGFIMLKNHESFEFIFKLLDKTLIKEKELISSEPVLLFHYDRAIILVHPLDVKNKIVSSEEYITNVFEFNKLMELNMSTLEINPVDGADLKKSDIAQSFLFSRRQLINLFIELLKKYRGISGPAKAVPTKKFDELNNDVENGEEVVNFLEENDAVVPQVVENSEANNEEDNDKEIETFEPVSFGQVAPPPSTSVAETPAVTIANAYNALDNDEITNENVNIIDNLGAVEEVKPEINLMKSTSPEKKKKIGIHPAQSRHTSHYKTEFNQRLAAESTKPATPLVVNPKNLPNIPEGTGKPENHPHNVTRRKKASERLTKILKNNLTNSNSEIGTYQSQLKVQPSSRKINFGVTKKNNRK